MKNEEKKSPFCIATTYASENNCDVLLLNIPMDYHTVNMVIEAMQEKEDKKENLLFILTTNGGSPDAAYKISKIFQRNYKNVRGCIAGWCKSAGTLCAIGAHSLIIADDGELGPLDIQILKQDEIVSRNSGLVIKDAFTVLEEQTFSLFKSIMLNITKMGQNIRFKTSTEIASHITEGVFKPIYEQIDPYRVGETNRSMAITQAYGQRLDKVANNLRDNSSLATLIHGYPSHGFVIDREEAKTIFKNVEAPNDLLKKLIDLLETLAVNPFPSNSNPDRIIQFLNIQTNSNDNEQKSEHNDQLPSKDDTPAKSNTIPKNDNTARPKSRKRTTQKE